MKKLIRNLGVILIISSLLGCNETTAESNNRPSIINEESKIINNSSKNKSTFDEFCAKASENISSNNYKFAEITYSVSEDIFDFQNRGFYGDNYVVENGIYYGEINLKAKVDEQGHYSSFTIKQDRIFTPELNFLYEGTPLTIEECIENHNKGINLEDNHGFFESFYINPLRTSTHDSYSRIERLPYYYTKEFEVQKEFNNEGLVTKIYISEERVYYFKETEKATYTSVSIGEVKYFTE